jgi:alkaline phosphatase D
MLDASSNKSRNDIPDTIVDNKTMLGIDQLPWLKDSLLNSNSTWKIISSDVPCRSLRVLMPQNSGEMDGRTV